MSLILSSSTTIDIKIVEVMEKEVTTTIMNNLAYNYNLESAAKR